MTKTYIMNRLVEKIQSPDYGSRCMALNDLLLEIKQDRNSFLGDQITENKVLGQVLSLVVEDNICEVKNKAVKCLGELIKIIRESQMIFVVDKLIEYSAREDKELRAICGLGMSLPRPLKTIATGLPAEGKIAGKAPKMLSSNLLMHLSNSSLPPDTLIEALAMLSILIARFPSYLSDPNLRPAPREVLAPLSSHSHPAVCTRAVAILAHFWPVDPSQTFQNFFTSNVLPSLTSATNIEKRMAVQLIVNLSRQSPHEVGPLLKDIVPNILKAMSKDDEELQESCLQALEVVVLHCTAEVTPFLRDIINSAKDFISYGHEGGISPQDTSDKIRRSAATLLSAIIATHPGHLITLYKEVSPVLVSRFGDREETVRVEVWATYGALLNQTAEYSVEISTKDNGASRRSKRKRNGGVGVKETPLTLLEAQASSVVDAFVDQLMTSPNASPATLLAGCSLLQQLLTVIPGALSPRATISIKNAAVGIGQRATEEDHKQRYLTAYKLYCNALEYNEVVLRCGGNRRTKQTTWMIDKYLSRAEVMKQYIQSGEQKSAKRAIEENGTSNGGASGGGKKKKIGADPDVKKLRAGLESTIIADKPNVKWDDVAGLDAVKRTLQEAVILPIKFPRLFTGKRQPWRGILLYGPPGTGKSYLAKAVATEAEGTFFRVSSSDLVSKWEGDSERSVKQLFEMARENRPAIIFVDEVDSLTGTRNELESEGARRIKTEFLVQMDGVSHDNTGVFVLGATNNPWRLDNTIKRRFEKRIYVPLPGPEARKRMFELGVGDAPCLLSDQDYRLLAERTEGFSGSDISIAIREALMPPVRKVSSATHFKLVEDEDGAKWMPWSSGGPETEEKSRIVTDAESNGVQEPPLMIGDFLKCLSTGPIVRAEDIKKYEQWSSNLGDP